MDQEILKSYKDFSTYKLKLINKQIAFVFDNLECVYEEWRSNPIIFPIPVESVLIMLRLMTEKYTWTKITHHEDFCNFLDKLGVVISDITNRDTFYLCMKQLIILFDLCESSAPDSLRDYIYHSRIAALTYIRNYDHYE